MALSSSSSKRNSFGVPCRLAPVFQTSNVTGEGLDFVRVLLSQLSAVVDSGGSL